MIPWREEEMVIATNPQHPIAQTDSVEVGELDGLRFVAFESALNIRRCIDRFLRKHGVHVSVSLEFDNIENIKRAIIELPDACTLLPLPTLEHELRAGTIAAVHLSGRPLNRPVAIIHRSSSGLGLTASRFLDMLLMADSGSTPNPDSYLATSVSN